MQSVPRLYSQFHPHHYDVHWDLSRAASNRIVIGNVSIVGDQLDEAGIRLHVNSLHIDGIRLNNTPVTDFKVDETTDELLIPHSGRGAITVSIDFSLEMTDAMHGLYPCYFNHEGARHELYATQFESHHAREAFPCVDEPEAKATFKVSLTHDPHHVALGNMPVATAEARDHATLTTFDTTPVMSTYLVAFVVGKLQRATRHTENGVEVNVYATPIHEPAALDFALEHAAKTIDYFDDYFGVPYPLPKSDHVALPDFSSGAMENWGLVTYREIALLADPQTTSISSKQYIATVIAHELSHQWFGNLVTMQWWDDLWLNESFATLMEYLAVDALHPEWNMWFEMSTNEGVVALRRDAIDGVQPVQVEVRHPDEISTLFDGAIVYAKGGRLLRMLMLWLGNDDFRAGLTDYFKTHQYSNTSADDLWKAFGSVSGKDVSSLMHTWISQSGFPVVHVSLSKPSEKLLLTQEQFFIGPHQPSHQIWPIPLGSDDPQIPDLLEDKSSEVKFDSQDLLLLNSRDSAHFITHYDADLRNRIINALRTGKLDDVQRAQFLHEQTLLARAGIISSADLVELLTYYASETNERVWDTMSLVISDLKRFVETDLAAEKQLKLLAARLARPLYDKLGWSMRAQDTEEDIKLRATIIANMLYGEDPDAIAKAIDLFHTYATLDPELRGPVMSAAVRHGGNDHTFINSLLDEYKTTTSPDLQLDISGAVTATRKTGELSRLVQLLTDTDAIRTQDTIRWFVRLLQNRDSRDITWQWLKDKWPWINEKFGSDKSYDYFPRYTANIMSSRAHLDDYKTFFEPLRDNPTLTRTIDMGILELQGRVDLIERARQAVADALSRIST